MPQNYPQKSGLDSILKQAFFYWSKTLMYQLLFSLIYFSIIVGVASFFSAKYGIFEQILSAVAEYNNSGQNYAEYQQNVSKIVATDEFSTFYFAMMATVCFLYPLNVGFYEIFRKIDAKEEIFLMDLFAGYSGINFFRFLSYFVFWLFVYLFIARTLILPVLWVMLTMVIAPMLYFSRLTFFSAITLHFGIFKKYFVEILVCIIVAVAFKLVGFFLFLVGGLFTFPFWNAIIFALFKEIFSTHEMQNALNGEKN